MDRQCSSCGGFCKKSGCKRENVKPEPEAKKYTEAICPVCGYYCLGKGGVNCIDKPKLCGIDTAPPQREWVGLTDDERKEIALEVPMDAVFITEAKLKEKNK